MCRIGNDIDTVLHGELCNETGEVCVSSRAEVLVPPGSFLIRLGQAADGGSKAAFGRHLSKVRIEN